MSKAKCFPAAIIPCLLAQTLVLAGDNSADSWDILTRDTKLLFSLRRGRPVISDLRAVNYKNYTSPYNWAAELEEVQLPRAVEIGRHRRTVRLRYVRASFGKRRITFTYHSDNPRLELVSTWRNRSGGPIEHTVALTNRADRAVTFSPTPTIALAVRPHRAKELWWVEQTEAAPSDAGTHVEALGQDYVKSLLTGPNISPKGRQRDAIPWFCLQDTTNKEGLYGGIEFSGFTEILSEKAAGGNLHVGLGIDRRDGKTRSRIEPGGTFRYPTCFIGTYRGEVDDGCNRLHRWVEARLRPPMSLPAPMLGNNTWSPREIRFDIDERKARAMIDVCRDLGIELFEVDAGWYTTASDWNVDTKKFPNGMRRLSEYAHSKGIRFGLWIAWAHGTPHRDGGPNVLSPFNPVQKSWFTRDYPADWRRPVPWEGAPVCLGCPRARDWCLNLLRQIITDYQLDVLRQDQICVVENCTREDHDHIPNDPVDVSRAAARGYYEIYDRLRSEYPNLLFEGCNGGGRMADFGFLKRVHYYQLEDSYVPINTRRAFYDASFPFPPIMLLQWIRAGP
ncbi:MAG: glycoside hydrolase family 36 protein, partial [Planctomycetota bacterium]